LRCFLLLAVLYTVTMKIFIQFLPLLLFFLAVSPGYCETIKLKTGKYIKAPIVEKTESFIKLDIENIPITYYYEQIESIDGEPVSLIKEESANSSKVSPADKENQFCNKIIEGILSLRDRRTNLVPSHFGHPGYAKLGFLYDEATAALILKACGRQKEAEDILDYFAARLAISDREVSERFDTNFVYGILKVFASNNSSGSFSKSFVNAFDVSSIRSQGKSLLEIWTTPGPTSFMIYAFLKVNREKYKDKAIMLGKVLLAMQKPDGGIEDGDRAPNRVHTEPHVDAAAVFFMLYEVTGERTWLDAGDSAYEWFKKNVYHPEKATIDQGFWQGEPSVIFATDVYSWTMAGPFADEMPPDTLKALTENMLKQNLVWITLELPNGKTTKVILCDFSNPDLERVKQVRNGFHPMGSVEWTGGVILALSKNAVRFRKKGEIQAASYYKALAEILSGEVEKCFYPLQGQKGLFTFYSTGQGIEVGPFGSLNRELTHGWNTPFFYVKTKQDKISGASIVGAWPILAKKGLNPFILNDNYLETYKKIPCTNEDMNTARKFLEGAALSRSFQEAIPQEAPDARTQIVEPAEFNNYMWASLDAAYEAKNAGESGQAKKYFSEAEYWAMQVAGNKIWVQLAERDNALKEKELGGIVAYPWGNKYPDNDNYLHYAILRYPLLNEVATAMWALAVVELENGNKDKAAYWLSQIIDRFPLHQIADVAPEDRLEGVIQGYWNVLSSCEEAATSSEREEAINALYKEILKTRNVSTLKPKLIILKQPAHL